MWSPRGLGGMVKGINGVTSECSDWKDWHDTLTEMRSHWTVC